jgi:hypothetical protein
MTKANESPFSVTRSGLNVLKIILQFLANIKHAQENVSLRIFLILKNLKKLYQKPSLSTEVLNLLMESK